MTSKWTSILIGVLAYVFLSLLSNVLASGAGPLGAVIGCLVVLVSGIAAVWHYTSTNGLTIAGGTGAGMGALVGLMGALISVTLSYVLISAGVLPDPSELAMQQMRERGMTREQMEQAEGMAQMFSSPLVVTLFAAVFGAIGGAVGGALGASLFKKGGPEPAESGF